MSTRRASRTTPKASGGRGSKRTNGKFEIQVFPASSLGKETDINQGMTLGTVDMIISGPSFAARNYPRIGIAYYPFIFRDADHLLAYSKSDVFKEMIDGYRAKTGIQILAYTYYGARHTTSQKAFTNCAGMKGLKIRVPDVPSYRAPRPGLRRQPDADRLRRGLRRCRTAPSTRRRTRSPPSRRKFYEVQKHIMLTGHIVDGLTTQVAPHVWNKLSDAEKKIFADVALEAAARATAQIKKREGERRRVQEEGPGRARGGPQELRRRGAQGQAGRVDGLRSQGLRPHRRHQVRTGA
ncbi:MAG: TRAP transporter substrate-binding protein DctP [Rubrivivax sp.]